MHRGQRWTENLPLQTGKAFFQVLCQVSHFTDGKSFLSALEYYHQRKNWYKVIKGLHLILSTEILCVLSLCKSMGRNDRIHHHFWANLFLRCCFFAQIPLFLFIIFSKTHIVVPTSNVFTFLITACPNISCQKCQKAAHWNDREGD